MPPFAKAWRRALTRIVAANVPQWGHGVLSHARNPLWLVVLGWASLLAASGWVAQAATENGNLSPSAVRLTGDEDAQRLADAANVAYVSGHYARAVQLYTQLLGMKPADARVFFNRGNGYSKLRDSDRALADYSAALRIAPEFVQALVNRGALLLRRKQFAEGLSDFEKAATARPDDGLIAYHRGLALARSGRGAEAADVLDRAIALAPGFAPARAERGFLYLAADDAVAAAMQFETALKLEPANARARSGLRLISASSADLSEASDDPIDTGVAGEFVANAHRSCFSNADDGAALAAVMGKLGWMTSTASSTSHGTTWSLASPFGRGQLVHIMPPGSPRTAVCTIAFDGVTSKLFSAIHSALGRRYATTSSAEHGNDSEHSEFRVPHGDNCEVTISLHGSADDGRFTVHMSHEKKRPVDM